MKAKEVKSISKKALRVICAMLMAVMLIPAAALATSETAEPQPAAVEVQSEEGAQAEETVAPEEAATPQEAVEEEAPVQEATESAPEQVPEEPAPSIMPMSEEGGIVPQAPYDTPNTLDLSVKGSDGQIIDNDNVILGEEIFKSGKVSLSFSPATGNPDDTLITYILPDYYSFDPTLIAGTDYGNYIIDSISDDTTNNAYATRNKMVIRSKANTSSVQQTYQQEFAFTLNSDAIDTARENAWKAGTWDPNGSTAMPATTDFSASAGTLTSTVACTYTTKAYDGIHSYLHWFSRVVTSAKNNVDDIGQIQGISEHGAILDRNLDWAKATGILIKYTYPDLLTYGPVSMNGATFTAPDGFHFTTYSQVPENGALDGVTLKNLSSTASATISGDKKTATLTWTDDETQTDLVRVISDLFLEPDDQYWTNTNQIASTMFPANSDHLIGATIDLGGAADVNENLTLRVKNYTLKNNVIMEAAGNVATALNDKIILQQVPAGTEHTTGDVTGYPSVVVSYVNRELDPNDSKPTGLSAPLDDGHGYVLTADFDSRILAKSMYVGINDKNPASMNYDAHASQIKYYTTAHPEGVVIDVSSETGAWYFLNPTLAADEYLTKIEVTWDKLFLPGEAYNYQSMEITNLKYSTASTAQPGDLYPITYTVTNGSSVLGNAVNYIYISEGVCPKWVSADTSGVAADFIQGQYGDDADHGNYYQGLKVDEDFLGMKHDAEGNETGASTVTATITNPTFTFKRFAGDYISNYFTNGKVYMDEVLGGGWTATVYTTSAEEYKAGQVTFTGYGNIASAHTYTVTGPATATGDYTWDLYAGGTIPSDQVITDVVFHKEGVVDLSKLSNIDDGSEHGVAVDKTLIRLGIDNISINPLSGLYTGGSVSALGYTGAARMSNYNNAVGGPLGTLEGGAVVVQYDDCLDVDGRHSEGVGYAVDDKTHSALLKGAELLIPTKIDTTWTGTLQQNETTTVSADIAMEAIACGDAKLYSQGNETFYLALSDQQSSSFVPGTAKVDGVAADGEIVTIDGKNYLKITNLSNAAVEKAATGTNVGSTIYEPWKISFDMYTIAAASTTNRLQIVENSGSWIDISKGDTYTYSDGGNDYTVAIQSNQSNNNWSNTWNGHVDGNANCKDDPLGLYTSTAALDHRWAVPIEGTSILPTANAVQGISLNPGYNGSYQPYTQSINPDQEDALTTALSINSYNNIDMTGLTSVIKIPRVGDTLSSVTGMTTNVDLFLTGPLDPVIAPSDPASTPVMVTYSTDGGATFTDGSGITDWSTVTHIGIDCDTLKVNDTAMFQMPLRTAAGVPGYSAGTATAANTSHAYWEAEFVTQQIEAKTNHINTYEFEPFEITGKAWVDANGNGNVDSTESGKSGVTMTANIGTTAYGSATTAADGSYTLLTNAWKGVTAQASDFDGFKVTKYDTGTDNVFNEDDQDTSDANRIVSAATIHSNPSGVNIGLQSASVTIDTDANPVGTKTVVGTDAPATTFTMTLAAADNGTGNPVSPMPATGDEVTTVSAAAGPANYQFGFGDITFDEPGTYNYTVTETALTDPSWSVSPTSRVANIVITVNADMTYSISKGTITNTYALPGPIVVDTSTNALATKTVVGDTAPNQSFNFTLAAATNTPASLVSPMPSSNTASIATTGAGNYTIGFGNITFNTVGTYNYTITESALSPANPSWACDTAAKTITVTVTKNSSNQLEASITAASITNTYTEPTPVTLSTSTSALATKTVAGTSVPNQSFNFTLAAAANTPASLVSPMPSSATSTLATTGAGNYTVDFGSITYTEVGTYHYTVAESALSPADPSWACDTASKNITVTVTKNSSNQLEASVTAAASITNTYSAPGTASIQADFGKKTVVAANDDAPDKTFTFAVSAGSNDSANPAVATPLPAQTTASVDTTGAGDYDFGFGTVTFTAPGTYHYNVTETSTAAAGWTMDTFVYDVRVIVIKNPDNTLTATISTGRAALTNTYASPTPVPVDTSAVDFATKTVADTNDDAPDKAFDFAIAAGTNDAGITTPAPANTTASVATTGAGDYAIDFGSISFARPGTYHYTVTETSPAAAGWSMDTTPKDVVVTVSLDTSDNTLSASVADVTITNTYTSPAPINVGGYATKTVVGTDAPAMSFDFAMDTPAAGTPAPASLTATTATSGAGNYPINFGNINFTKVGTYSYTFHETTESAFDWICDSTPVTATVTVTLDTSDNTLHANVTAASITNTYSPGTIILETPFVDPPVTKNISGETPTTPATFEFEFKAVTTGAPMPSGSVGDTKTGSVVGAGSFEFGNIYYTQAGVYEYTINEIDTGIENYDFDSATYKMKVEVKQAPDYAITGLLLLTRTWEKDGVTTQNDPEFTNNYATPKIEVTKSVDKSNVYAGDVLTYTLHVTNNGARASQGIFVKDYIPANTTYVSSSNGGTYSSNGENYYVKWWLGDGLDVGESMDITMKVSVNSCQNGTEIANVALWQTGDLAPSSVDQEDSGITTNQVISVVGAGSAKTSSLAKTGDSLVPLALVGVFCLAGAGALYFSRRRREEQR